MMLELQGCCCIPVYFSSSMADTCGGTGQRVACVTCTHVSMWWRSDWILVRDNASLALEEAQVHHQC